MDKLIEAVCNALNAYAENQREQVKANKAVLPHLTKMLTFFDNLGDKVKKLDPVLDKAIDKLVKDLDKDLG